LEFVGARRESYRSDSRKPIVEDGSLEDDQNRRDFTINALAISLQAENYGQVIDPFQGLEDLQKGILRTPLDPELTFSDDPLRMMRAIRFATQLQFQIEPKTLAAISSQAERIKIISQERITAELEKILASPLPSIGFKLLFDTGLLALIFPELHAMQGVEEQHGQQHKDNFYHTLEVVDNMAKLSNNIWLRWAALLHDIAKPLTKRYYPGQGWTFHGHEALGAKLTARIFKRMKLPLDHKLKYVQKLVSMHQRPILLTKEDSSDSALRRLLFEAGEDIDDLLTLCQADSSSKIKQKRDQYLENLRVLKEQILEVEAKDKLRQWQPPITGEEIMASFGIGPGREVGLIKNAIREAILDGVIPNEHEAAYRFMVEEGQKLGLTAKPFSPPQ
jgi:putative nucleotidyltransferase with HDIG domain